MLMVRVFVILLGCLLSQWMCEAAGDGQPQAYEVVLVSYEDLLDPQPLKVEKDENGIYRLIKAAINPSDPSTHLLMTLVDDNFVTFSTTDEQGQPLVMSSLENAYEIEFTRPFDHEDFASLSEDQKIVLQKRQRWLTDLDEDLVSWMGNIVRFAGYNKIPIGSEDKPAYYYAQLSTPSVDLLEAPGDARRTYVTTSKQPGQPAGEARESRFKILLVDSLQGKNIVRGQATFDYLTQLNSWFNPSFHAQWKIKPAAGKIKFDASLTAQTGSVTVAISEQPVKLPGGMYYVTITMMHDDETSPMKRVVEIATDVVGSILISKEDEVDSSIARVCSYEIMVNHGNISVIDTTSGKQLAMYTNPNPLVNVQCVGFGGTSSDVRFSQIAFEDLPVEEKEAPRLIYIPDEFIVQPRITFEKVACGVYAGKSEIWGVSAQQLYCALENEGKFEFQPIVASDKDGVALDKIHEITIGADGTVCCLNNSYPYQLNRESKVWTRLADNSTFDEIVVGQKNSMWGINGKTTRLYYYTDDGSQSSWVEIADACVGVAAGGDNTIVVINDKGAPYVIDESSESWLSLEIPAVIEKPISDPMLQGIPQFASGETAHLINAGIKDRGDIYGLTQHGQLVQCFKNIWRWVAGNYTPSSKTMSSDVDVQPLARSVAQGIVEYAINSFGVAVIVDADLRVYIKTPKKENVPVAPEAAQGHPVSPSQDKQVLNDDIRQREDRGYGIRRRDRRLAGRDVVGDRMAMNKRLNEGNLRGKPLADYLARSGSGRAIVRTGTDRKQQLRDELSGRSDIRSRNQLNSRGLPGDRPSERPATNYGSRSSAPSRTPSRTSDRTYSRGRADTARPQRTGGVQNQPGTRVPLQNQSRSTAPSQRVQRQRPERPQPQRSRDSN